MKVKVKKTQWLELQCVEQGSSLVNKIYKQYFGVDISDTNIRTKMDDNGYLVQYQDTSYHGSPVWEKRNEIKDPQMIQLHNKIVPLYYQLLKMQKKCRNQ